MTEFSRRAFVTSVVGAMGAVGVAAAVPGATAQAASPSTAPSAGATPRLRGLDVFLRATGVNGDSLSAQYRGWIEVTSWSWGTLGVDSEPLTFTTRTGRHTATLMGKAFSVAPIDEVVLAAQVAQSGTEVLTLTLKNAIVAQVASESGARTPVETWSLPSYSRADLRMRPLLRATPGPWESMTWPAS